MSTHPLQIIEGDLKGPCTRLNRRFDLVDDQISKLRSDTASGSADSPATSGGSLYGTHAERLSDNPPASNVGGFYVETDRNSLIYQSQFVSNVATWVYVSGTYDRTQSQLAALAATLGTPDAGLLVNVTDHRHVLRWSGSVWGWGPGEEGGDFIRGFQHAPVPLDGWQICDGTATTYLKADGTTGSFTTEDLVSAANKAAFAKLGRSNEAGIAAAVAPGYTDPTIGSNTTGITINSNTTGITIGTPSALQGVTVGAINVASSGHVHTPSDPGHNHSPSDAGHNHTATGGDVDDTGTPRSYQSIPYYRR